ncbi:hypothetical protein LOAG_01122 [Loa loa]|uniref:Uncharacterized protein n=1 Tax=Loa loa TaxID=7209 RepID=A0A1S0U9W1_LOALO|nr:hypothetical protein LOAG_01122 [Loa loa]EFO27352.1 hypothetical protein LOAG_01122 [Loa loa]
MSLSGDQEDNRKNHIKRQSADSPLTVMSPSVRPQSTKLFRLSKTPLGPKLANINQVDPNIDATLLELCSVEKEAVDERYIASECNDVVNVTDVTSSSMATALSPGMSDEMKSAIKTYLKSTPMYPASSLDSKAELLNVVENIAGVGKSEDIEELNISISTRSSQERAIENNAKDIFKVGLFVPGSEFSAGTTEANSYSGIEMNDFVEASFTEVAGSPVLPVENAKAISSITPNCLAAQVGEGMASSDKPKNLTLSACKNKVFATRNLNLDNLSSPRELASYAEERAQNYSFLINEAYCETSVFCENCYSMRIELGLFSDKFAALTATVGDPAAEGNIAFVAEMENLLRRKQAEIVTLSSELRDLNQANLYETEDLVNELKQAKPKQSFKGNTSHNGFDTSLIEGCQMEVQIGIIRQQLDTAHSLHQKAQERIKELESNLQKVVEEKNQLSLELQEAQINLVNEKDDRISSNENKHISIISLLEAKVAELGNKIDEAFRVKEDETVKQKSFLFEKLASLLEKMRTNVKSNVFASEWEADDIEISVIYFERAVNIICQDNPQFEILVGTVAQHGKLARNKYKQLETMMEEVVEEKKKWEMLFTNEKSRLDSLQDVMLAQFCENKNYFSNLLQDFQNKWADMLHSVTQLPRTESEENRNCAVLEILHHIENLQEKLNEKWSKDSNELQRCIACLKEQHLIVTSFQAELQEMRNRIEMLHETVQKDFKNSSALLCSLQGREVKQDLKRMVEHLQKVEEDIKPQNTVFCKNLDFGLKNFGPVIHVTENLTREKDNLENENVTLKNTISKLERENRDLKQMEEMYTLQDKKTEELEHRLNLLQKENERLGKACDDADEEVSDLKEQIFELLRVNAKLQAEMHGESEDTVNRRMGYIEPPAILPRSHLSIQRTTSGMNSPNVKVVDVTESPLEWKAEVEKRKEMQRLAKKDVLAEAAKALTKRIPSEESPKSKAIQNQSCRTS